MLLMQVIVHLYCHLMQQLSGIWSVDDSLIDLVDVEARSALSNFWIDCDQIALINLLKRLIMIKLIPLIAL